MGRRSYFKKHIATLVDRKSRYTVLVQVEGKDTKNVVDALIRKFNDFPDSLKNTLTWDPGMEPAAHKCFTNENTDRLLRQYFPKKTNLRGFDQIYLDKIANKLNKRPRRILKYLTPTDMIKYHIGIAPLISP